MTIGARFTNQGSLSHYGQEIKFGDTLKQTIAGAVTDLGGGKITLLSGQTFDLLAGNLTGGAGATIGGSLSNGGTVGMGAGFGALTITGDYTQTAAGTLAVKVAVVQFDSLKVAGKATLAGHLQVAGPPGTGPYDILQAAGGVFGTFADVTAPWSATYFGNDVKVQ